MIVAAGAPFEYGPEEEHQHQNYISWPICREDPLGLQSFIVCIRLILVFVYNYKNNIYTYHML